MEQVRAFKTTDGQLKESWDECAEYDTRLFFKNLLIEILSPKDLAGARAAPLDIEQVDYLSIALSGKRDDIAKFLGTLKL